MPRRIFSGGMSLSRRSEIAWRGLWGVVWPFVKMLVWCVVSGVGEGEGWFWVRRVKRSR